MKKGLIARRPSAAMLIAVSSLFIALGGTSYAAFSLPKNSVGSKQLKNGAVTTNKIQNGAVTAAKINPVGLTATNALHANGANTAANATNANHAASADNATNASNATNATNASNATNATHATNADHANSADGLTVLPSGQSESGAFSAAGGTSTGGYLGFGITYPRPLTTAIPNNHIIDTSTNPDPTHCPQAGQAAPGYLCLYFQFHQQVGSVYGYSTNAPYSSVSPSVGVGLYGFITNTTTGGYDYVNGVWTVTAP